MARRTAYVSFFGPPRSRSRDFAGFESKVGPARFAFPLLAVALIAVSVWWFAFREADEDVGGVLTLEDATIPTLLLPTGAATDDPSLLLSGVSIDCATDVIDWTTLQGGMTRQGCVQARTITNPKIVWQAQPGIGGWLNSPIIVNGTVYVGSAGVAQGQPDRRDGVWAFDLYTGDKEWFFGTTLDVNGIAFGNGIIVATGDEGRVWGIDARSGDLVWKEDLGVATYGYPLVVDDLVVIGDGNGFATAYDIRNGTRRWQKQADGSIRGGASSDGERIVFAGENREVVAVDLSGEELWRVKVVGPDTAGALARIWAAPTFVGDFVVITMLREDTFIEPAITALNKSDGSIAWQAEDAAGIKHDWGSIRSSVAVVGDLLVFGEPYSDRLVAVDVLTGETMWDVATGAYCYPQWPSPAVVSGQVILPRHDGGLYAVSVETETPVWEIFLGDHDSPGAFPAGSDVDGYCDWGPEDGYSILASPAVAPNGYIVVGTLEGWLFAVGDKSWG